MLRNRLELCALSFILLTACTGARAAAEKLTAPQLIGLAKTHPEQLREAIETQYEAATLAAGMAFTGQGPDFFFAVSTRSIPRLFIDETPGPKMHRVRGSDLWYVIAKISGVGHTHIYHYLIDGQPFGGSLDVPVFGPLSYRQPRVPAGQLSEKLVHTSAIYDGMKSTYWVYVPAQYDPGVPAALIVFLDGAQYIDRESSRVPVLNAIDNLIAQRHIPVTISVFINQGDISESPGTATYEAAVRYEQHWSPGRSAKTPPTWGLRGLEYDTVSDRFPKFLSEELLPELAKTYNLRRDAYSRAITGMSSGGIAAFNAAWQTPAAFSRVLSWVGSFVSAVWKEDPAISEGGQDYPDKVLREARRNIRVWLQGANHDLVGSPGERWWGSQPFGNLRMAQALKSKDYDFHLSFGEGTHNPAQGAAEFPESMIWLWRGYDAKKTEEVFAMDPEEKARPPFIVKLVDR